MARQVKPVAIDEYLKLEEVLPALKDQTVKLVRSTGEFTVGLAKIYRSLLPLTELINRRSEITEQELHLALDELFLALQKHPLNQQLRSLTTRMRSGNLLPNEASTENLIRFLVEQVTARSVVPIPPQLTDEFWKFFNELMSEPELRGLGEVSLDVLRIDGSPADVPLVVDKIVFSIRFRPGGDYLVAEQSITRLNIDVPIVFSDRLIVSTMTITKSTGIPR